MTWLKRVQETLRSIVLGPYNAKDPALARLFGSNPTHSGIGVTEYTALNLSAVWCAVVVIAGGLSALPLDLMRRTSGGRNNKERFVDHPTYELVHARPNPEMSSLVFRRTVQANALVWGNGYAEIERDQASRPLALWPLTPDRVYPYREPSGDLIYRVANADGTYDELEPDNMLHIPGLGFDGTCGYSVIGKARETLGLSAATERFGAQFFGNGANMTGALSHPGKLSDTAHKHLEESLDENHSRGKARRALVLEEGMTWTQMGVPPDDGQFLETRKFQVTEIARWFNLPPHKLKDLERATFSNIEQQSIEFVQESLLQWIICWEQELDRKLVRPLERRSQFFKHNLNGLLRGDTTSRYSAYAVGRQWDWLSANDIRDLEDMNSIGAQGDIYLMPGNMLDANGPMPTPGANTPPTPPPADAAPARHAELQAQIAAIGLELVAIRESLPTDPSEALTGVQGTLTGLLERFTALTASRASAEVTESETVTAIDSLRSAIDSVHAAVRDVAPPPAPEPAPVALTAEQGAAMLERMATLTDLVTRALTPPPVEPAEEPPAPVDAVQARDRARLITGHRAAIEDAVARLVRRESLKARRAAKSPDKLRAWIADFYPRQQPIFESILLPAIQAHVGAVSSDREPADVTRELVAAHIEASRAQLHGLLDAAPPDLAEAVDDLLDRWERDRPAARADALMEEELIHAP